MVEGRAAERTGDTGRIVLLTGLSGAGKTTALKAFEDVGFEVVDNIPFSLLDQLLADDTAMRLAIGLDVRTRGFTVDRLLALKRRLEGRPGIDVSLVFLDCDDEAALRRFTETRRRHPLTGLDEAVGNHICNDPGTQSLMAILEWFLEFALPRYEQEGKSYLTLAIGCTGGRHRSVFIAEQSAELLRRQGWTVNVVHRELGISHPATA